MQLIMRRLYPRGATNRGICVDAEGATLGPDCVLVRRTSHGFTGLQRDRAETLQRYGLWGGQDRDLLFRLSQRIADALNKGEIALAQIYGLHIPVADLDDRRLARISRIDFARGFNPDEPRVPKDNPHGGEWTAGDAAVGDVSPDVSGSGDSSATAPDGATAPGIYAVTADDGNSPESAENGIDSPPSSAEPPMKFEWGPPVSTPPAPPPPADGDTGPTMLGSDDVGDAPAGASATTEPSDQSADPSSNNAAFDPNQAAPPQIPSEQPDTTRQINGILRSAATWLGQMLAALGPLFELDPRVRLLIAALEATLWLTEYLPKIFSYLDLPRTLEELQNAVADPQPGYETHHIVEAQKNSTDPQSNAQRFPDRIDSAENLVRVPYWKHVRISSWYSAKNELYDGLTPREFLRGKSWEYQYWFGLDVLRKFGVLR